VEGLVDKLKTYHSLFKPAFRRSEQADWAEGYLQGLLGNQPRKSVEPIALSLGVKVRDLQHFIGQSHYWHLERDRSLVGDIAQPA